MSQEAASELRLAAAACLPRRLALQVVQPTREVKHLRTPLMQLLKQVIAQLCANKVG